MIWVLIISCLSLVWSVYSANHERDTDGRLLSNNQKKVHATTSLDGEIYFDGDSEGDVFSNEVEVGVIFHNNFDDKDISLHWIADDGSGDDVILAEIFASESVSINTFLGHRFYAHTHEEHPELAYPEFLVVEEGVDNYSFGPRPTVAVSKKRRRAESSVDTSNSNSLSNSKSNRPISDIVKVLNERSSSLNVKFRSLAPRIDMWFDGGGGRSVFQGSLMLGQESTINTYEGHVFFFTIHQADSIDGHPGKEIARYTMSEDQALIEIEDSSTPPPAAMLEKLTKEKKYLAAYLKKNGIPWRHYFGPQGPRAPPTLFMWPAHEVGESHSITSSEGHWSCNGPKEECQSSSPLQLSLEVVDVAPKAFVIHNFLSAFETDKIISYAAPLLGSSLVGDDDVGGSFDSETRTSKNAWVKRSTSQITESLFRRAADVLNVDEALLHTHANAEDLQVVHYLEGQRYEPHHDWGVSGYAESRYITLLLYLNDKISDDAGGDTSFPKGAGGKGFKIHPGKGSAVLFYNLLEDGNGDDLALHSALPVHKGEKWLANFWVWDPKRK